MKQIELKCNGCGISFLKNKAEYNRQIKKGNSNFYCTSRCCGKSTAGARIKHIEIERECLCCNKKFLSTTHKSHKKCCNITCAKRYSQSKIDVSTTSESLKKFYASQPKKELLCVICKIKFPKKRNETKTCSRKCLSVLLSQNSAANPNCGGETNYKKFKYKDVWMDSSWEVNLAKWLDNNSIEWKRDRKINFIWTDICGKKRRYYPDFYLPKYNIYLDPKNKFKLKKDEYKLSRVILENNIKLIYGLESDVICQLKKYLKFHKFH